MSTEEQKKGFFDLLDPKSALLVGLVGGLLSLGTLGFIVLGTLVVQGKVLVGSVATVNTVATAQQQPQQQVQQQQNNQPAPVVPKSDKPKVELYVMAYCPYGLQMEKAFVPAWNLLKNKADISIKFVSYAMHGKKEVDENTRQYCIQSEQPTKYQAYLSCFFSAGQNDGNEAKYQQCLTTAGVNQTSLNSCIAKTDKQYAITAKYNDQSTWLSGRYPLYPIHDAENIKYGVQGSPTLVINGVQSEAARTADGVKQAICNAFNNAPSECSQNLGTTPFQPGFGMTLSDANAGGANAPGCGT